MKVIDLVSLLSAHTAIRVRRAFGDDEARQYFGIAQDYPADHCYANRIIIFIWPYQNDGVGDVPTIAEADSLDIAVGDYDEGEKFFSLAEYGENIEAKLKELNNDK